jgi:hypothetical protein
VGVAAGGAELADQPRHLGADLVAAGAMHHGEQVEGPGQRGSPAAVVAGNEYARRPPSARFAERDG